MIWKNITMNQQEPNNFCNRIRRFLNSISNSIEPIIAPTPTFQDLNDKVLENNLANQRIISQNLLNTETRDKAIDDLDELKSNRPNWLTTFQNK